MYERYVTIFGQASLEEDNVNYRPQIFNLSNARDKNTLKTLVESKVVLSISDKMSQQYYEYLKNKDPNMANRTEDLEKKMERDLNEHTREMFGTWVYYPWSRRLVHLLPKKMYRELRFNRNRYKITTDEQNELNKLRIGIVGLSTGKSCALSLALEGIGGSFRLADYDTLSLSNLNRIQSGIHNININKSVLAAREIYELNPYIDVKVYADGLNSENLENFLCDPNKLDIVVEECDDIFIKLKIREEARRYGIPVLMATSERGMIDIERFDLEPERPIFHGLVGDIDSKKIEALSTEDKIPYVMKIIGTENLSDRSKASMVEIGESTSSFAQLASNVLLGVATIADVTRRIFLKERISSGRYFIDFNELINGKGNGGAIVGTSVGESLEKNFDHSPKPISINIPKPKSPISEEEIRTFIELAATAPSGGNCQPWYFVAKKSKLLCYHDEKRSRNFLDFNHHASYMAFGALTENFSLTADAFGRSIDIDTFPDASIPNLICSVSFSRNAGIKKQSLLFDNIPNRSTNRRIGVRVPISETDKNALFESADFDDNQLLLLTKDEELNEIGEILGEIDRIRILNRTMHAEMMNEIRWNSSDALATRDGIDLATLEMSSGDEAGMRLISSYGAMSFLNKFGLGRTLRRFSKSAISGASGVGLIISSTPNETGYFNGGRAVQRVWLSATALGLAIQPMTTITYLFDRLEQGEGVGFSEKEKEILSGLRERYLAIFGSLDHRCEAMLFRIARVEPPSTRALRRSIDDILTIV